ncbi:MAG: hypothetical protein WBP61_09225 [Nocardioides sp.]
MTSSRTVAEKMGIKSGWTAHLVGAPEEAVEALRLPDVVVVEPLEGEVDYLHLFVRTREQLRRDFPALVPHVAPRGKLWVSWPKGGRLGSDLGLPSVIEIGYDSGMVESTCLRIDDTWAALRFTHPKKGKTYRNSYGTLPPSTNPETGDR